ncbi:GTPase [Candidatus Fermentibacteria bacterium]|nr:GTPase [Candidatus Fermentibacteria bacterium]
MSRIKTLLLGAAGRDFHNFNVVFREDDRYEVVGFTAAQIPDIDDRKYPPELAGKLYPEGIPIMPEDELEEIVGDFGVELCVLSYSDLSDHYVMTLGARVNSAGADVSMLGAVRTMLESSRPVVAVCAVRTGSGKSQTTRRAVGILQEAGRKVVVVRHPMPYGDLRVQRVQRFETIDDLERHDCTIEEMEEYEPHINRGTVVYAGVDYEEILRQAEKEADVILWDGGNNDTPFYLPDLHLTVADPHRPGHELSYYPGQINVRLSDAVIINKVDSAYPEEVAEVRDNVRAINPSAKIIEAASAVSVDDPASITGKRVLVVEDGPTLTHGGMDYGAGIVAAQRYGAAETVDPRPFARGSIVDTFELYYSDHKVVSILPAMGYGDDQMRDLQATINSSDADTVVVATPIDLARVIEIDKPCARVTYELQEIGRPNLVDVLQPFLES